MNRLCKHLEIYSLPLPVALLLAACILFITGCSGGGGTTVVPSINTPSRFVFIEVWQVVDRGESVSDNVAIARAREGNKFTRSEIIQIVDSFISTANSNDVFGLVEISWPRDTNGNVIKDVKQAEDPLLGSPNLPPYGVVQYLQTVLDTTGTYPLTPFHTSSRMNIYFTPEYLGGGVVAGTNGPGNNSMNVTGSTFTVPSFNPYPFILIEDRSERIPYNPAAEVSNIISENVLLHEAGHFLMRLAGRDTTTGGTPYEARIFGVQGVRRIYNQAGTEHLSTVASDPNAISARNLLKQFLPYDTIVPGGSFTPGIPGNDKDEKGDASERVFNGRTFLSQ